MQAIDLMCVDEAKVSKQVNYVSSISTESTAEFQLHLQSLSSLVGTIGLESLIKLSHCQEISPSAKGFVIKFQWQ